jgi:type IV secretion system protein VirD4
VVRDASWRRRVGIDWSGQNIQSRSEIPDQWLARCPVRRGSTETTGVGCVILNLLTYQGSVLVTDAKGENYAVTARARRSLGQAVHALGPFDAVGGTAALNPLDLIDTGGPDALDDARLVADYKAGGEHAFWNEEARGLLTGFMLRV